jgi:choline dehydrogenase
MGREQRPAVGVRNPLGRPHTAEAGSEVVVSLGAFNTPKLLMQSGLGDAADLQTLGIPVVQHLPGVGRNHQDHPRIDCGRARNRWRSQNSGGEVTFFWKSDPAVASPDIQVCVGEFLIASDANATRFGLPEHGWTMCAGLARPKSRGRIRLTGPHPDDMKGAIAAVELCREIGSAAPLRPFVKREVMPGNLTGAELEHFVRDAAETYWHSSGTAKMGPRRDGGRRR